MNTNNNNNNNSRHLISTFSPLSGWLTFTSKLLYLGNKVSHDCLCLITIHFQLRFAGDIEARCTGLFERSVAPDSPVPADSKKAFWQLYLEMLKDRGSSVKVQMLLLS